MNASTPPRRFLPGVGARHGVALMLFVTVAINYVDRSNLSIAAPGLAGEMNLDPVHLGLIFSAFGWAYALFQIPGGWLVDRIGSRALYAIVCGLWSCATVAQGFAATFLLLFGFRLLLGLFEAPAFPLCNRLATRWFPANERARAIAFYTSAQYLGLGFLTPLLALAQRTWGWRSVFILTGGVGLAWAAIWYWVYREPSESRRLSATERELIRSGGGWLDDVGSKTDPMARRAAAWRFALGNRSLWGIYLGQFCLNAVPWFFLTWFPSYLVTERHVNLVQAGLLSSLPFVAAFLGVISSGLVSDLLVRRGVSASVARKAPIIAGMLLSTTIIGANFTTDPRWAMAFMTVAFFGNGFASITWVLVSLLAPRPLLGFVGGMFNFCGNLASIAVPLVVGFLVQRGGFVPAVTFVAGLAILGVLSYVLLVGAIDTHAPSSDPVRTGVGSLSAP